MLKWILPLVLTVSAAAQQTVNVQLLTVGKIQQYQRVELGVELNKTVKEQIKNFFKGVHPAPSINPFDPGQIDVRACFISPSGDTIWRNGFFYVDCSRDLRTNNWQILETELVERIRVAPHEVGNWKYKVWLHIPAANLSAESKEGTFMCNPGSRKGPVDVEKGSSQLRYRDSGEKFKSIGCNITHSSYKHVSPQSSLMHLDWIEKLSNSGGNFFRLEIGAQNFLPDWESPNTYGSKLEELWELDHLFDRCEELGVYILMFRHHVEWQEGEDWQKIKWSNNSYHTQLGLSTVTDYFFDSTAIHFQNMAIRYLEARYGYSPNWMGYSYSEIDHIAGGIMKENNLDMEEAVQMLRPWFENQITFMRDSLLNNQILFSYTYADLQEFEVRGNGLFEISDVIGFHKYGDDIRVNSGTPFGRLGVLERVRKRYTDVPVFAEEIGFQSRPDMVRFYCCTDSEFHDAIWATYMMDLAGTGLHWWWDLGIFDKGYEQNYRAISEFNKYMPEQPRFKNSHKNDIEAYWQVTPRSDSGVAWLNNSTFHWSYAYKDDSCMAQLVKRGYLDNPCNLENGKQLGQKERSPDGFENLRENSNPNNRSPRKLDSYDQVKISGLRASVLFRQFKYEVKWYSVGNEGLKLQKTETVKSNAFGRIALTFPNAEQPTEQQRDYAVRFKLIR